MVGLFRAIDVLRSRPQAPRALGNQPTPPGAGAASSRTRLGVVCHRCNERLGKRRLRRLGARLGTPFTDLADDQGAQSVVGVGDSTTAYGFGKRTSRQGPDNAGRELRLPSQRYISLNSFLVVKAPSPVSIPRGQRNIMAVADGQPIKTGHDDLAQAFSTRSTPGARHMAGG